MLASKIIPEIIKKKKHSEVSGCANFCNKFVAIRPWQTMKLPMILLQGISTHVAPLWKDRGKCTAIRRPWV